MRVKTHGDAFDRRLDARKGHIPAVMVDAAVHVNDTLELAFSSAQQVFGNRFSAADVLGIYDRIQSEWLRRLGGEGKLPP